MRIRKEIEEAAWRDTPLAMGNAQLEALLDIRDMLANPVIEVSGQPMDDREYRELFSPKP